MCKYKRHIIAFIDILGFGSKITAKEIEWQNICNVLKTFKASENVQKVFFDIDSVNITPNVIAFSDNVVISVCPMELKVSDDQAFFEVLNHIHQAISCSIKNGFLVRGAIAVGDLYVENGVIFGPALVEAVELEKNAKYPRVILSDECVNITKRSQMRDFIKYDMNASMWYFDYFKAICEMNLEDGEHVFQAVDEIIKNSSGSESKEVKKKIEWIGQEYKPSHKKWEEIKKLESDDRMLIES